MSFSRYLGFPGAPYDIRLSCLCKENNLKNIYSKLVRDVQQRPHYCIRRFRSAKQTLLALSLKLNPRKTRLEIQYVKV